MSDQPSEKLIGEILIERQHIQAADLEKALQIQAAVGGRIGSALLRIGALSEDHLLAALSSQLGITVIDDQNLPDANEIYRFMAACDENFEWFLTQEVAIWPEDDDTIACVARDFLDPIVGETLRMFHPRSAITYYLISGHGLDELMRLLEKEHAVDTLFHDSDDTRHLRELAEEAPVIELVNNILAQAVDVNASDIHLEPSETVFKVRVRVDGVLHDRLTQPYERYAAVASRIKLISGLDIAERRLPQDGRITIRVSGQEMDIRVSCVPCMHGESIVLRLLPKDRQELSLENLGMAADHLSLMKQWANSSGGIILVTGPTGSGKSTTLNSALVATNDGVRKIITVEDPVEIQLPGVIQIQTHADIGYTFARALRAILRHDPDVIMIGEIRDLETAEIAIQSALSGHLVLSTLHTNDAISSFTRLIDMGVEPFLVAAPIKGVQAQRLVRRVCGGCAEVYTPPEDILRQLSGMADELTGDNWVTAQGCDACQHTGYKGRIGIYQLVSVDSEMQDLIVKGAPLNAMKELAVSRGYRTLYQDGLLKASHGVTTLDEVLRVITGEESA